MLSDILPTGFECGVLNGQVKPGDSVAIVGAGPIGLAALLTAQFYSPAEIIMVDLDDNRLRSRARSAPRSLVNSAGRQGGRAGHGADRRARVWTWPSRRWACRPPSTSASRSSRPAAGSPTWACTASPCQLALEKLWSHNITLTTRLVDTAATPMLLKVVQSGQAAAEEARHPPLRAGARS